MKLRPSTNEHDGDGLDSLLDTMTNVVGILVMVLIATQLGVRDAVVRIAESDTISAEDVESARKKLQLTKEQRDTIQSQLNDEPIPDDTQVKVQLADLRRKLNDTRTKLDQEKEKANQYAVKISKDEKKAESAKKAIKEFTDSKQQREKLRTEISRLLQEEATLKALLDKTQAPKVPPPKIVTLPDPRPAPEGARQIIFLCSNKRVYPIAADDIRKMVRKKAELVVEVHKLYGGPKVGVDKEKFLQLFERRNPVLRDDYFDLEVYAAGIYPRIRFTPRENAGETQKRILNARSRYQQALSILDKKKYYARFIVLPDSFEVYLVARALCDKAGLQAGWSPQGSAWKYVTHLGGPILFGPKPPPNPNPPQPGKKPTDVID